MKVLQIIDSLPETSGGARFVVNLTKRLKRKGITCDVLLIDGKTSQFLEELKDTKIQVHRLGINVKSRYRLKYIKQIAQFLPNYDIAHVHIFPGSYLVSIAKKIAKNDSTLIFTEHSTFNRRSTNFLFRPIEKFIYKNFDHVVGISPETKTFIMKYLQINESKISVIYNGVDHEKLKTVEEYQKRKFNLTANDIAVLMAARFSSEKDQKTLIKAFSKLPQNYKLLLAGAGSTLKENKEFAKSLDLNKKVYFLGNRKDIYRIMKMSDINVLSSNYEGFGLSIVEAMALKKPVIGSNVDGMDKVIKDAGLLFEKGDDRELSELIFKLGSNDNFYNKISAKCFERSKQFSLSKMTDKYIEVYEKVIAAE